MNFCYCSIAVTTVFIQARILCNEAMNLNQAVELLKILSAFPSRKTAMPTEIQIAFYQGEGYILRIHSHLIGEEFRGHLEGAVKLSKLLKRESNGYLVIYGNL